MLQEEWQIVITKVEWLNEQKYLWINAVDRFQKYIIEIKLGGWGAIWNMECAVKVRDECEWTTFCLCAKNLPFELFFFEMMPDKDDAFSTRVQHTQNEHDCGAIIWLTLNNKQVCVCLCLGKVTRTVLRVPAYDLTFMPIVSSGDNKVYVWVHCKFSSNDNLQNEPTLSIKLWKYQQIVCG